MKEDTNTPNDTSAPNTPNEQSEDRSAGGVTVSQAKLDRLRAYTEQMRVDLLTVRMLVARGQGTAAGQLLGGMLDSTLLAGMSLDDAGANRPDTMRPKPTGVDLAQSEREANE